MAAAAHSFATKKRRVKVRKKPEVKIEQSKCTGCGACTKVCPTDCLLLKDGKTAFVGDLCMACCHCEAVCPEKAVTIEMGAAELTDFETFSLDKKCVEYGATDTGELVNLLASRRSCRNFAEKEVPIEMLRDLVRAAVYAPSATNVQQWSFTILANDKKVRILVKELVRVYEEFNHLAPKRLLRKALKFFGKPELDDYYNGYYSFIKRRLAEMQEGGRDVFFRGATAAIIVSGPGGLHCQDDAMLATENILLTAHSMGLGSCLVGMANAAIRHDAKIKKTVGIPIKETVHSVIALGYPQEPYKRVARKFEPKINLQQ